MADTLWTAEALLARAKAAEDALLHLTCSGSEFFIRDGDGFRVDVPACVAYIRRLRQSQHETIVREIGARKAAEAALAKAEGPDTAEAEEAADRRRMVNVGGHRNGGSAA